MVDGGRIPIIVCGAAGRMGRLIIGLVAAEPTACLAGAIEAAGHPALGRDAGETAGVAALGVPVSTDYAPSPGSVTLDFTAPTAAMGHLDAAARAGASIVIGTTGLSAADRARATEVAARIPVVLAPNMSAGVTVLEELVAAAARALGPDFDVEVSEIHHRLKRDAPSGTALRLAEVAASARGTTLERHGLYGRQGEPGPRTDDEIGVLALRGGDVVGDHTVFFLGAGERLELTHRAQSRECLARGALRAALWLAGRPAGLYSMKDVLRPHPL